MRKKSLKCKLQHFNVLIIDEISMVDALLGGVSLLAVGGSSVFASPYSCLGSNDSQSAKFFIFYVTRRCSTLGCSFSLSISEFFIVGKYLLHKFLWRSYCWELNYNVVKIVLLINFFPKICVNKCTKNFHKICVDKCISIKNQILHYIIIIIMPPHRYFINSLFTSVLSFVILHCLICWNLS